MATNSNRISHQVHHGWWRLAFSTITTVSCTWHYKKLTHRPVHVNALTWNPLAGHACGPVMILKRHIIRLRLPHRSRVGSIPLCA